jgi:hypothetical protein
MTEDIAIALIVATVFIFFFGGFGYMLYNNDLRTMEFKQQCIETGKQYINGSCVK